MGLGSSREFAYIFFPLKLKMFMLPLEPIELQFYWIGWALRQSGGNNKFKKKTMDVQEQIIKEKQSLIISL